ncbi:hypothetical protein CDL15_Pgr027240 [Punica granatum]|uniref:Uncharacterized protein n=1 Tax=Punica granatum TaxID=22663 RepID=A0A218VWY1_PUNGR|nr:hypothetical protein CDL15_Pgr027240 [Punica granatum]
MHEHGHSGALEHETCTLGAVWALAGAWVCASVHRSACGRASGACGSALEHRGVHVERLGARACTRASRGHARASQAERSVHRRLSAQACTRLGT